MDNNPHAHEAENERPLPRFATGGNATQLRRRSQYNMPHQLHRLASTVASSVLVIWFLVLVYPCGDSVDWAESAGLVLDSINFLAHLLSDSISFHRLR